MVIAIITKKGPVANGITKGGSRAPAATPLKVTIAGRISTSMATRIDWAMATAGTTPP